MNYLRDTAEIEDDQTRQRFERAQDQWPTLDACWGCLDCKMLFKQPENGRCPHCRRESCFNAGKMLNTERIH